MFHQVDDRSEIAYATVSVQQPAIGWKVVLFFFSETKTNFQKIWHGVASRWRKNNGSHIYMHPLTLCLLNGSKVKDPLGGIVVLSKRWVKTVLLCLHDCPKFHTYWHSCNNKETVRYRLFFSFLNLLMKWSIEWSMSKVLSANWWIRILTMAAAFALKNTFYMSTRCCPASIKFYHH